ncbi:hypothetical protein B0H15DRAFT_973631 [Mycena belliarum]|uniref:Protein kinase domain-containing protein n=1 Tax=Mycena belliarum TaxID=1033014 RepID=A0AAD6TKU2_9AGAR|nr:hypothetical protein B0H15DRAFT_973631 [Mycena belliae]
MPSRDDLVSSPPVKIERADSNALLEAGTSCGGPTLLTRALSRSIKQESFTHIIPAAPTIDDQLRRFFRYLPGTLAEGPGHTKSDSTRPPGYYDRHLSADLRLKKIKYLPTLLEDLAQIADDSLASYLATKGSLPPLSSGDDTSHPFPTTHHIEMTMTEALNPIVVESDLASFYDKTTSNFCRVVASTLHFQLSKWDTHFLRYSLTSSVRGNAIADGFLKFDPDLYHSEDPPPQHVIRAVRQVAEKFPDLAVWEYKNLRAGNLEAMEAILDLAAEDRDFNWACCEKGELCRFAHSKSASNSEPVTGDRMGFDAVEIPFPLAPASLPQPRPQTRRAKQDNARDIAQQTWAEAVRKDASFAVVQSGNLEMICLRHRKSQTMFVSRIQAVGESQCPAYGKLHTGLYIAIMRDALDRTSQLQRPGICLPQTWLRRFDAADGEDHATNDVERNVGKQAKEKRPQDIELLNTMTMVVKRGHASNSLPFLPSIPYMRHPGTTTPDKSFFTIQVAQEFRPFICCGTINLGKKQEVIVKHAHAGSDIRKLISEYNAIGTPSPDTKVLIPYAVLVTPNIGEPLSHRSISLLNANERRRFRGILQSIHDEGYVHGHLKPRNMILHRKSQSFGLVSFAYAQKLPVTIRAARQKVEFDRLEALLSLSNARKRPRRIHGAQLGPMIGMDNLAPEEAFRRMTEWIYPPEIPEVSSTERLRGLPDWIDVVFKNEEDRNSFQQLWNAPERPQRYRSIKSAVYPVDEESSESSDSGGEN